MCLKDTANTLNSKCDLNIIERYKKIHAMGAAWPEITAGMKEVGIMDMEIYISDTNPFMLMDKKADYGENFSDC